MGLLLAVQRIIVAWCTTVNIVALVGPTVYTPHNGTSSTERNEPHMMQTSLAARLRLLRAKRGLTVKDAAAHLGVDRHTLRRIELGTQEAQYPTLAKIAEGYGVPIEDLFEEPVLAGPKAEAPQAGAVIASVDYEQGDLVHPIDEVHRLSAIAEKLKPYLPKGATVGYRVDNTGMQLLVRAGTSGLTDQEAAEAALRPQEAAGA